MAALDRLWKAISEALFGQIYLVTVVALLIARLRVRRNAPADADDPSHLVTTFAYYTFTESPVIRDGQTFGVAQGAPLYHIHEDDGVSYESGSLFSNPYGTWRLMPC